MNRDNSFIDKTNRFMKKQYIFFLIKRKARLKQVLPTKFFDSMEGPK